MHTTSHRLLLLLALLPLAACEESDGPKGSVEQRQHIKVVKLRGTAYQMGRQHAALLREALIAGYTFVEEDPLFSLMLGAARDGGYIEDAAQYSYPDIIDECQGLVDEMGGTWTMDHCLTLNYGDVIVEYLGAGLMKQACSQFVMRGPATADGRMIHGRNLDWSRIEFIEQNPVVFLREPDGKLPWMAIGFPGNMSPYTGMNAEGIAVASNEADARTDKDRVGRSHVQMVREILQECRSLDEAEAFLRAQDHTTAEILTVSDGVNGQAAVFEMTANHLGMRTLDATDLVYVTNHFTHPDMVNECQDVEPGSSTWNRRERLRQLLEPDGPESVYGTIDVPGAIAVLRDTYNPFTGETLSPDVIDGGKTLANNGAMQSVVFLPAEGILWVGMGVFPVTMQPYVGFSIHELLGEPAAVLPDPASYPGVTPP